MEILLSPVKSIQTEEIRAEVYSEIPHFISDSEKLDRKLKKLKPKSLSTLMDISMDLANLNHSRFQNWSTELPMEWLPAAAIFTGEVYKGLNYNELSESSKHKAQERLRILSGLYGLLKPADLILPYRLEMGTPFQPTPKETSLYSFWRQKLTKQLASELNPNEIIVNLASAEYSKEIDFKKLKNRLITPTFKEFKNGKFSTIMIFAKHARGSMSRYLIENELEDIEQLKTYNVDNYEFETSHSSENELFVVR
jgi:cytoplasmic iron level regulating protein YaaA (DUF328/UPF0246 family)